MSPPALTPLRARAALARGWHELWRAPAATFLALAGALVAVLAARATWLRAGEALAADRPGRALATLLAGGAFAALVADATRAAALTAYAGAPRSFARTVALGMVRTPAMISVRAVELLVYFTLAVGEAFVLVRALPALTGDAAREAAVAALCLLPALALSLVVFAASRVAQALIARGLPSAAALAHGYDVVLRRFPALARLALLALAVTAPFWIIALLVPAPLGGLVLGLPALWLYAALATLVGRDGRLALG
ncbi:MAG TPA: hypothetical protein VGL86_12500 [Polyangia bacterium]